MPIIAVEEHDEVSRLLSDVATPDVRCTTTISIETPPELSEDEEEKEEDVLSDLSQSFRDTLSASIHRQKKPPTLTSHIEASKEDESPAFSTASNELDVSTSSTFELCSIGSCANLSEYNANDSLNASLGRSGRSTGRARDYLNVSLGRSSRSIGRSSGKNPSSQNNYMIIKVPSSGQPNRSIGNSTHGNTLDQSRHSTGTKRIADIAVIPKKESIDTKYFIDYSREIGRGTNTIVRKCVERANGNRYAVKSVRISDKTEYEHMRTEANLLTALNHPSIIQIYDTYEDDKYLHMVVEICKGGELYDHVVQPAKKKTKGSGPNGEVLNCPCEEVAAVIVRRVVDAVAYLHEHNIVHRDLKLENLLFKSKPDDNNRQSLTEIRVIDFGLSRRYNTHHRFASLPKLTSFVGTKFYVAPEVLNHSYTHAVDIWSIGVLAYALLSAKAPFMGRNDQELFDKIQHCGEELKFPSPDFDNVSDVAKDFIRSLLVKDASSRPTACELLEHPWMVKASRWKNEIDEEAAARGHSKPSVFKKLFGRFGKGKKAKGDKSPPKHGKTKTSDLDNVTHKSMEGIAKKS